MNLRKASWRIGIGVSIALSCGLFFADALHAFQRPFHQFGGTEYRSFEIPPDWDQPAEWTFARLMYPPGPLDGYSSTGRFTGDWHRGLSLWTQDYPRADRHFSLALRRLSRLQVRSAEQPVDLEDGDEAYNWPWLYAVQVGEWGLTEKQGALMREYLLRGGFFVADDFHGLDEWAEFEKRIKFVFPDREIEDIPDNDPIFHNVYDLDERIQVVGHDHLREGSKNGGNGGVGAHWRAIYDDHRRVMVAISYNSDLGDGWEWADDPYYPEKFSGMAIRIGVNYVLYAMTH
jgi:Domain of unknown function (DUF4159)